MVVLALLYRETGVIFNVPLRHSRSNHALLPGIPGFTLTDQVPCWMNGTFSNSRRSAARGSSTSFDSTSNTMV
jgi:hypothetical protein